MATKAFRYLMENWLTYYFALTGARFLAKPDVIKRNRMQLRETLH